MTSNVLIKTSTDRVPEIAEQIAALEGVREAYSVTGAHDLEPAFAIGLES